MILGNIMATEKVRLCQCQQCQENDDHPDKEYHRQISLFAAQLNGRQKRWFAALESSRIGAGGVQLISNIIGISAPTIHQGRRDFVNAITELPKVASTKRRSGRPPAEKKQPTLERELERLIINEIAGDPMTDQKWVRVSLRSLSKQLNEKGLSAAPTTVRRILKKMGFSLRANFKKKNGVRANYPERDEQFKYIATLKDQFTVRSLPIVSVDTKKKELIGNFKKSGRSWRRTADEVDEHDFPSIGVCRAVPYGIYDVNKNLGYVFVGVSNDT